MLRISHARQEFVPPDREVMTRNAFRRTALETRCQLYFPGPDEDIVLLRTGFLKHIQVLRCWPSHHGTFVGPVPKSCLPLNQAVTKRADAWITTCRRVSPMCAVQDPDTSLPATH